MCITVYLIPKSVYAGALPVLLKALGLSQPHASFACSILSVLVGQDTSRRAMLARMQGPLYVSKMLCIDPFLLQKDNDAGSAADVCWHSCFHADYSINITVVEVMKADAEHGQMDALSHFCSSNLFCRH